MPTETRTPMDVITEVLGRFSDDEAEDIVIIWNSADSIQVCSNLRKSAAVGMMESAKHLVLRSMENG